jgi:enoyl-CoA hydratase/carnithine racemase
MARTVPSGTAEKLCLFAQMATAQQALSIGMVDEVVNINQVLPVRHSTSLPTYMKHEVPRELLSTATMRIDPTTPSHKKMCC